MDTGCFVQLNFTFSCRTSSQSHDEISFHGKGDRTGRRLSGDINDSASVLLTKRSEFGFKLQAELGFNLSKRRKLLLAVDNVHLLMRKSFKFNV